MPTIEEILLRIVALEKAALPVPACVPISDATALPGLDPGLLISVMDPGPVQVPVVEQVDTVPVVEQVDTVPVVEQVADPVPLVEPVTFVAVSTPPHPDIAAAG